MEVQGMPTAENPLMCTALSNTCLVHPSQQYPHCITTVNVAAPKEPFHVPKTSRVTAKGHGLHAKDSCTPLEGITSEIERKA